MFEMGGGGNNSVGNIGARNIDSVKAVLLHERIKIAREDVGGNYSRTVSFDASTGEVTIKSYGRKELKL